jgi:hypothetical protein
LLVWMVVFTIINLTVLALRFYTVARVKKRRIRLDDILIVLSVAAMLAMEGTTFWGRAIPPRYVASYNSLTDYAWCHSDSAWSGSSDKHITLV